MQWAVSWTPPATKICPSSWLLHHLVCPQPNCYKPPLHAEYGPHNHQTLSFFCFRASWAQQCLETGQLTEPAEQAQPHPTSSPQAFMRWCSRALYLKTIHFTQQKPSYSISALQYRDWLLASTVAPLILPKSNCPISLLQRAVVYFGMLFLFCKKCFVFVLPYNFVAGTFPSLLSRWCCTRANGSCWFDMLRLISSLLGNSLCFQALDQRKTLAAMLTQASLKNKAEKKPTHSPVTYNCISGTLSLCALSESEEWG